MQGPTAATVPRGPAAPAGDRRSAPGSGRPWPCSHVAVGGGCSPRSFYGASAPLVGARRRSARTWAARGRRTVLAAPRFLALPGRRSSRGSRARCRGRSTRARSPGSASRADPHEREASSTLGPATQGAARACLICSRVVDAHAPLQQAAPDPLGGDRRAVAARPGADFLALSMANHAPLPCRGTWFLGQRCAAAPTGRQHGR